MRSQDLSGSAQCMGMVWEQERNGRVSEGKKKSNQGLGVRSGTET